MTNFLELHQIFYSADKKFNNLIFFENLLKKSPKNRVFSFLIFWMDRYNLAPGAKNIGIVIVYNLCEQC